MFRMSMHKICIEYFFCIKHLFILVRAVILYVILYIHFPSQLLVIDIHVIYVTIDNNNKLYNMCNYVHIIHIIYIFCSTY